MPHAQTDFSIGRFCSGPVNAKVSSPGQSGVLKGKAGGKDQRGNMSANSHARSRSRWAPARKASTKAR